MKKKFLLCILFTLLVSCSNSTKTTSEMISLEQSSEQETTSLIVSTETITSEESSLKEDTSNESLVTSGEEQITSENFSSSSIDETSSVFSTEESLSSFISSEIVTSEQDSTNNTSSGNSSSNDSTSESNENAVTIKKIKEQAQSFLGKENSVGVYESNIIVEIELKLISCLDAITTKQGYGNRYKILMSDGEDYIYVKTTDKNYEYLKQYVNDQGVYLVKGNISLYNKEVEITTKEKPTYLSSKNIEINYEKIAKLKTLEETYDLMESLKLNCKGIAFSQIVKVEVKCLAKDINNTNVYFGNGNKIVNVHGNDKVTNKFVVGNSYLLYGSLNVHNFRPGLEYVYSSSLDKDIEFFIDNLEVKKASEFYNYTYETDKYDSYPNYSKLFETPYVIEGYVNSYIKDGKEYIVLEDKYNENYYSTYQNARSAKSVFFVNENYIKLTASNSKYCPIYEHLEKGTKLKVVVFPYLWNSQKYPQVYCYYFEEL